MTVLTHRMPHLARAFVMFVCCASLHVLAANNGDPSYRITVIGNFGGSTAGVYALNDSGQATGSSEFNGVQQAFIWTKGAPMVDLGPFDQSGAPTDISYGFALNRYGQVAGEISGYPTQPTLGFLWRNDGTPMIKLPTLGGTAMQPAAINDSAWIAGAAWTAASFPRAVVWKNGGALVNLGTFGGSNSKAVAINNAGQVTGWAGTLGDTAGYIHAFFWQDDGKPKLDLGTLGGPYSEGVAINAFGQVTGSSSLGGKGRHAFLWRNDGTPMLDLGTLVAGGNSVAVALNDSGAVTGFATTRDQRKNSRHAFLWRNDGTPMLNLGTLGGLVSEGLDINAAGWVVGWSSAKDLSNLAFLWRDDGKGMRNLNDLIDPADPLKARVALSYASTINNAGDILAGGTDSQTGQYQAYLLRTSALAISPHSLAFGNQGAGTASAARSISVQNNSASAVPITSIKLAGAGASQFVSTSNCGSSVAGKGSCTINVTFRPTSAGAKQATLTVNGGGGGLRVVNLTGTGT